MFILLLPVFIVYITVIAIYFNYAQPKDGIWFGVALPKHALKDIQLLKLQREYRNAYTLFAVLAFVAALPLIWLSAMNALAFIYLFLWIAGVVYSSALPFKRIHHMAAKLKRDHDWFVTNRKTISIDKEMAHLTGKLPLSPYWFIVPALMSAPLIFISVKDGIGPLKLAGFASLLMTIIIFFIYIAFSRGKLRAYSRNPVPNLAINQAARHYWSILWLTLAIFEAINAFIAYYVLSAGTSADLSIWIGGIFMVSLVPMIGIYIVHNFIKELEYRYANTDGSSFTADDDIYWRNGLTYYNNETKAVFVPKRIGVGSTVNMATRAGKRLYYGAFVFVAAVIIPVAVVIIQADTNSPKFLVGEDGIVSIENTKYPFNFNVGDVIELTLEEKVPSGFRSNGIATANYARGNFKLSELGDAKLYVFKKTPPYIVIQLEELYVILNEEQPESTKSLYDKLQQRISLAE